MIDRWRRAGCPGRIVFMIVALTLLVSAPVRAQEGAAEPASQSRALAGLRFLAGGAAALALHESGHVIFDVAFDAHPRLEKIQFGPFPFFAITHDARLTPRQELIISSAGLWVQYGYSEWLLTTHPRLKEERAPFMKGALAFHVLTAGGYGMVALARAGPSERDTRGIAYGARLDERAVSVLLVAPAVLDAYRYFNPDSRWAAWASRAAKLSSLALVAR